MTYLFIWTLSTKPMTPSNLRLKYRKRTCRGITWAPNIWNPHPGINFLDLRLTLDKGKILNDLYCKPTDCHQYLSFTSCHPPHVKRSIVYSQAMRVHRLCSSEIDVKKNIQNLTQWFIKRGYPPDMVEEQVRKAKSTMSGHPVGTPQARNKDISPLVLTYHPVSTK